MAPDVMQPLTARQVQATMRLSVAEGAVGTVFGTLTGGGVLVGYALFLGARPVDLGMLTGLPLLGSVAGPLVVGLVAHRAHRKDVMIVLVVAARALWLGVPALVALPVSVRLPLLIGIAGMSGLLNAGAGAIWASLMSDVVPPAQRGRYFGLRSGLLGVIGAAAGLLAGQAIDHAAAPRGFVWVLSLGALLGVLSGAMMRGYAEAPGELRTQQWRDTILTPWHNAAFRPLLAYTAYWYFAATLPAPFITPYLLRQVGLSFSALALWTAGVTVTAFAAGVLWGRIADRTGNRPVLMIVTTLTASLQPLFLLLAARQPWALWASAVVEGTVTSALALNTLNLVFATSPAVNRVSYVASFSAVAGLAGFLGGLLSAPLLTACQKVGGLTGASGYAVLFVLCALLRLPALSLLRRVQESGAWRTTQVFTLLGQARREEP